MRRLVLLFSGFAQSAAIHYCTAYALGGSGRGAATFFMLQPFALLLESALAPRLRAGRPRATSSLSGCAAGPPPPLILRRHPDLRRTGAPVAPPLRQPVSSPPLSPQAMRCGASGGAPPDGYGDRRG